MTTHPNTIPLSNQSAHLARASSDREPRAKGTYLLTPELKAALLAQAKLGAPEGLIAEMCGIGRRTLINWLGHHDEEGELGDFAREFRKARAGAHNVLYVNLKDQSEGDPKTGQWLLERLRPADFGARGMEYLNGDAARPETNLTDHQLEFRIESMIANPSGKMLAVIKRALERGNTALQEAVEEHVRSRTMVAEGVVVVEPPVPGAPALPEPVEQEPGHAGKNHHSPAEVARRASAKRLVSDDWMDGLRQRARELLAKYDRIIVGGAPCTGKSDLFGALVTDRPLIHTDNFIETRTRKGGAIDFELVPQKVAQACAEAGNRWVVEGTRAVGVARAGAPAQCLVWLSTAIIKRTQQQETMAKGRETDFAKFVKSGVPDGLVVVKL